MPDNLKMHSEDAARLSAVLQAAGYVLTEAAAERLWSHYSHNTAAAGWLLMPATDAALVAAVAGYVASLPGLPRIAAGQVLPDNLTPALTPEREAEIRQLNADWQEFRHYKAGRPSVAHTPNTGANYAGELLAELDRRQQVTADLLTGLVKLLTPPAAGDFPHIAVARIHKAAARLNITL